MENSNSSIVSVEDVQGKNKIPRLFIDSITVNDGSTIKLSENQIVVLVGPNNAGKSVTLKDIHSLVKDRSLPTKVVKSAEMRLYGELTLKIIESKLPPVESRVGKYQLPGLFFSVDANTLIDSWSNNNISAYPEFAGLFTKFLSTEDRLKASLPAKSISLLGDLPTEPIQFLQLDDEFEKQFSNYFKQAFGLDLIVNRGGGSHVPLHVGYAPDITEGEDRVSRSYLLRLKDIPTLEKQGDGMRSFVGVLLSAFVSESVLFIDEPEAFLHPPQANILGQMINKDLPNDKQIFISTHSEDFIKGLLNNSSSRVKIIRIQRNVENNSFNILDGEDIKELWNDPLLRYSNILSGLFHSRVVVCESDGDCRFYGAMIDAITDDKSKIKPDILFVHCGGKQRIPTVVNALVKLGVKVSVVTDFDILNEKNPFKDIFEGLGGDWLNIESAWKDVKKAVDNKKPELNSDAVKAGINKILHQVDSEVFPNSKGEEIRKLLKKSNPWSEAKNIGKSFIPAGDATKKITHIFESCKLQGLHILEIGELECFDKSFSDHGPRWVNQVLEKDLAKDPELELARKFVMQILEH